MDFEWKQRIVFTLVVALPLIFASHIHNPHHSSHWNSKDLKGVPPCPSLEEDTTPIPSSFDARINWPLCGPTLWEIRDQGSCSSWASAVSSVLTDRICIASNATINFRVSESDLLACAMGKDEVGFGCGGAHIPSIWDFLTNSGTVSGGQFGCRPSSIEPCEHSDERPCDKPPPQLECSRTCTNPEFRPMYEEDLMRIKGACAVQRNSEKGIQREILKNGPVLAIMNLYDDLFSYNVSNNKGVYENLGARGDVYIHHAVKILGWGTTVSDDEGELEYWIVANSWNYQWGDGGFFKVLRSHEVPRLGAYITQAVSAPVPIISKTVLNQRPHTVSTKILKHFKTIVEEVIDSI